MAFNPIPGVLSGDPHPDTNPGRPGTNRGPQWPRGHHDDLMTPSGSTIGLTPTESLRQQFAQLGIPGAHTRPRNEIVSDYYQMLRKIHDDAGSIAVDAFLQSKRV
jgi:hypothetical protein